MTASSPSRAKKPLIVALDFSSAADALAMAARLDPAACRVKVGKELFTRAGPAVVEALQAHGFEVFLDLKFHDIPNTVAGACRAAAELGVWMVNVHASGGRRMMQAAAEAMAHVQHRPLLTAVTVLTSMEQSDLADIGLDIEPVQQVRRLARLATDSGLDGVVCSAQEAAILRAIVPAGFCLVTPGIRLADAASDDQRRIATPATAIADGVDYLVMGRPVTQAADPAAVVARVNQEIGGV